jgi:ubiquinone/menaquinone biosynthesis C-methylase UbiE
MSLARSDYLRYQYDDSTRLRVRIETHRLYSESPDRLQDELLQHLQLRPAVSVLDVGCGHGRYHAVIAKQDATIFGVDSSPGMLREARTRAAMAYPVHVVQADAQALPFMDASFDRVLAIHMLYHVPDRLRALQEFRRVLRSDGRVVLATNGARYLARLDAVHRDAAQALGYMPSAGDGERFTLEDVEPVRQIFPSAERYVLSNALVFHEAEPLVRYYASGVVDRISNPPADGAHRQRLIEAMRERVQGIIDQDGAFRDPKDYGFFVADVA